MFDINKITEVGKVPIEKLIAYKPEQCSFRIYAFDQYACDDHFCAFLSTETETNFKREDCCCTNEVWIAGCPLLKDSILVVKG